MQLYITTVGSFNILRRFLGLSAMPLPLYVLILRGLEIREKDQEEMPKRDGKYQYLKIKF